MLQASNVCQAKHCISNSTKVQERDDGGKRNGNHRFCGIFSNTGSKPGLFFLLLLFSPFLGFPCVSGNVSHVSTLSCPVSQSPQWLLAQGYGTLVWDVPGPVFTSGRPGSRQSCGAEVSHSSRGSLIPGRLH